MTAPVTGSAGTTYTPAASSTVDRPDQMGKDTFLKLLVAQMRYQDPSNPVDSSQMMAQTATFSQVEKLEQLVHAERLDAGPPGVQPPPAPSSAARPPTPTRRAPPKTGVGHLRPARQRAERGRRRSSAASRSRSAASPRSPPPRLDASSAVPHSPPTATPHRGDPPRASFHVLRHLRPPRAPDQDGRHRQQHRQRQHRRLQGQPDRLPGHAVPGHPRRRRPRRGPRRHKPGAGRPRRRRSPPSPPTGPRARPSPPAARRTS